MRKLTLPLVILGGLILLVTLISWLAFPGWRQTPGGFWLLLAGTATGVVALAKSVLDVLKGLEGLKMEEKTMDEKKDEAKKRKGVVKGDQKLDAMPEDRDSIERALKMARRGLATLEEQAAGYTSLTMPAHLKIQLEDKRREVAELEKQLKS